MTADPPPTPAGPPLAYATPVVAAADEEHLRLLAVFHFVLAGVQGLVGLLPLFHVAMGVMMLNGQFWPALPVPPGPNAHVSGPPPWFGWLFVGLGTAFVLFLEAVAVLTLLGGLALRRRRSRVFTLVVAGLNCLHVPLGTALGVFTIIVLSRPAVIARYHAARGPLMPLREYAAPEGTLVYARRGLGDPMVLVHGVYPGASHHEFDALTAALAARHTVYTPDLLGFGQSDAPRRAHSAQLHHHLLRDFIETEIKAPAHVIASGLSAAAAVRLGVYDDPWVSRLVLLAPPKQDVYREPPGLADRFSQFLLGTLAVGAGHYKNAATRDGLREFLRQSYHDNKQISRETVDELFVEANEPHKMMPYISALCGYFDADLSHWLPYVRPATLIVVGQDQLPVPQDKWLKPASWSRGKRLAVIPDTRDFPHRERPAATGETVLAFLNEA